MKLRLGKFQFQLTPLAGGELLVLVILIPYCLSVGLDGWRTWRHRVQFQEALEWFHAGDFGSAKPALSALLENHPEFAPAHEMLGHLAFESGKFDESIKHYKKALEFRPQSTAARIGLVSAYLGPLGEGSDSGERMRSTRLRQAQEALRDMKHKGADFAILRAQILLERNQPEDALPLLESVEGRRRGKVPSKACLYPYYASLGYLQAMRSENLWDAVENLVEEQSEKVPDLWSFEDADRVIARRGVSGLEKKIAVARENSEKAVRNLLRAIQIRPENPQAHRSLKFALGRPLTQVVLLAKEIRAFLDLGEYYRRLLADYDPFFKLTRDRSLEQILGLDHEDPSLLSPLGMGYLRIGRWADGEDAIRRARMVKTKGKSTGEAEIAGLQGYSLRLLHDPAIQHGGESFRSRDRLREELRKGANRLFDRFRETDHLRWLEEDARSERVVRILNTVAHVFYRDSRGIHLPMMNYALEVLDKALQIHPGHPVIHRNKKILLTQALAYDRLDPKDRERFRSALDALGREKDR